MRPGMVLAKEPSFRDLLRGLGPSVKVERLAGEMVRRAVEGEAGKMEGKAEKNGIGGFLVENGDIISAR